MFLRFLKSVGFFGLATLLLTCAANSDSNFYGRWELQEVYCNGESAALVAGVVPVLEISYRNLITTELLDPDGDGGGPCTQLYKGSFSQKGLTVTETPAELQCAAACTASAPTARAAAVGSCTAGKVEISDQEATYLLSFPDANTMHLQQRVPNYLCGDGDSETHVYTRG